MAKWGTYPPDEQLRLKRAAAEELYEALEGLLDFFVRVRKRGGFDNETIESWDEVAASRDALAKARGEAA